MAALPAEYDGRAVQAYIVQKIVGNGALIEQELEKSKARVDYCKGDGLKMARMQEAMIKQIAEGEHRISVAVAEANATRDVIQGMNDALNIKIPVIDGRIKLSEQEAETSLENLKGSLATLITELHAMFNELNGKSEDANRDSELKFDGLNKNLLAWSVSFRHQLHDAFALGRGGQADARGSGSRSESSFPKHDKKDLAVWKLADKVSKLDFRHWVDAVDINLECIYGLNNPEVMLDLVRREETEITKDSLERIIRKACEINLGLGR